MVNTGKIGEKKSLSVPQSANYLDPKIYEELIRTADSVADAVFRNSYWKLIFNK